MGATALITGGTGFIAAELVPILLERGDPRPVLFDISPVTGRLGNLADRVETVRGDLGNFSHVLSAVKSARPGVIYHLGAVLSVAAEADPAAAIHANASRRALPCAD